jgi:beta-phosphoglucomutase
VFDLDGVLVHSTPCHRAAFEQVFERLGIRDFEYSSYAGWRTSEVIKDVLSRRGLPVDPETLRKLASEKSALARRMVEEASPLDPCCGAVLARLAARYTLALASSGSLASIDSFLKISGARSLFRAILCGEDVTNAKPDPEIYLRCARQLNVDPAECLVIEDAVAGIEAARSAGARPVGIAGTCPTPDLERAGAAFVLSDLCALPAALDRAAVDRSQWTAIVPAAGRGSRLGFHRPKILFPVAGRPILDWLLDFLEPNCDRIVFVVSPEGRSDIVAELERRIPGRFETVIQHVPTGMGDAVALALPSVKTRHSAVVWGDQVALRRESVETCLALHQGPLEPDVTCPSVVRSNPYIHFERDASGRITSVLQAREGDPMPPTGESDTGFFCFRTERLVALLSEMRSLAAAAGNKTGEFNLLPVIPLAAETENGARVLTPRHMCVEETVGINSAADAASLEQFLCERIPLPGRIHAHQV